MADMDHQIVLAVTDTAERFMEQSERYNLDIWH